MLKLAIVGAGPAGIYAAYKYAKDYYNPEYEVELFDKGNSLEKRICPITTGKAKSCVKCKTCAIMEGFGGAGSKSDGKYNITTEFGGTLAEKIGEAEAIRLMKEVDEINCGLVSEPIPLFSTDSLLEKKCTINGMKLLKAQVRHFGTDNNLQLLQSLFDEIKDKVKFTPNSEVFDIQKKDGYYTLMLEDSVVEAENVIIAVGRSGSEDLERISRNLGINPVSNRVDIGVRVELPASVFEDITNSVYESKIVYTTKTYQDKVRTFCMNPNGFVVNENTNGIITVNGHSNSAQGKRSDNTNFALLVSQEFTAPFNNSNEYGRAIVSLSNQLGGGAIVQRLGDLRRGQRSTEERIARSTVRPTLQACPGDLSLVLPKRILDDILEMLEALNKIAPGTDNDDTLLYGVEVKFYNLQLPVDNHLRIAPNLYCLGDGSGITHSLSQAAASGIFAANSIFGE